MSMCRRSGAFQLDDVVREAVAALPDRWPPGDQVRIEISQALPVCRR